MCQKHAECLLSVDIVSLIYVETYFYSDVYKNLHIYISGVLHYVHTQTVESPPPPLGQ
jgi:hypothetical protein